MRITLNTILPLLLLLVSGNFLSAQSNMSEIETKSNNIKVRAVAEIGFLAVLKHNIQFSNSGTEINYVTEGGQDNLFPVSRLSLEVDLGAKNTFIILYQPLKLETQALLERDIVIDDLVYPAGSGVNFLYGFPFYRLSYLREFASSNDRYSFAFGVTVQIRNATIAFESLDGSKFSRSSDIGIVPALKLRTRAKLSDKAFIELEADGIYAPVSYLNGSDNEIIGSILDASLRIGYQVAEPVDAFLNMRYLGGGAVGTDPDFTGPGDGYTKNWLNFYTLTGGFAYKF